VQVNIPSNLQNYVVADLVDSDGNWNEGLLVDWLPIDILHKFFAVMSHASCIREWQ